MVKKEIQKFKFINGGDLVGTVWLNTQSTLGYLGDTQFTIRPSIQTINYVNYNVETGKLEYYCPVENIYKEINT